MALSLILTDLKTLNINSLFLYSFFYWMISFLVISLSSIWNCPYVGVSQSMKEALWFHCVYLKWIHWKSHTYCILLQNVNVFIMSCTLGWPYTEGTCLCCDFHLGVSCTVVVLTCFVMCGCVCVCVGVLVICLLLFTVLCIVCTVYFVVFHVYLFLFVLCVLVYGLLPPRDKTPLQLVVVVISYRFNGVCLVWLFSDTARKLKFTTNTTNEFTVSWSRHVEVVQLCVSFITFI